MVAEQNFIELVKLVVSSVFWTIKQARAVAEALMEAADQMEGKS